MIDPDRPVPIYRQLAEILRSRIADGTYTVRLPSIKTLTQEFDVSHRTAESAVKLLIDEGRVVSVVGRGVFINRPQT